MLYLKEQSNESLLTIPVTYGGVVHFNVSNPTSWVVIPRLHTLLDPDISDNYGHYSLVAAYAYNDSSAIQITAINSRPGGGGHTLFFNTNVNGQFDVHCIWAYVLSLPETTSTVTM